MSGIPASKNFRGFRQVPPAAWHYVSVGRRFESALLGTHGGHAQSFLAEFQYAFVHWLVSQDTAHPASHAFERWKHLVLAVYNAGEHSIRAHSELFGPLVDTLMRQCALLPEDFFVPDSFLTAQARYLVEDMEDSEVPALQEKSRQFAHSLESRQA